MISDDIIKDVYRKQGGRVSLSNVRSILELFEETQANKSKAPLELRDDEQVFVQYSYNNTETFNSLEQAIQYIKDYKFDYGWDENQVVDYLTVFVGRPVTLEIEQVTTIKFS